MKLYLTPSEQKTIEELSQAVGKTTKRVVTRSRAVGEADRTELAAAVQTTRSIIEVHG